MRRGLLYSPGRWGMSDSGESGVGLAGLRIRIRMNTSRAPEPRRPFMPVHMSVLLGPTAPVPA